MRTFVAVPLVCALSFSSIASASLASASEEEFLKSIEGQWTGGGAVLTKLGGSNVNVSCNMQSDANSTNFSMNGSCRALAVITRSFTASVKASGASYSGNYTGVSGKPSKLVGSRSGDTISFDVTWANTVYGDKQAKMTIQKVGDDGLRIKTVDRDPSSGKTIITTQLDLRRR